MFFVLFFAFLVFFTFFVLLFLEVEQEKVTSTFQGQLGEVIFDIRS